MRRIARLLSRFEFHLLLFALAAIAFVKPLVILVPDARPAQAMLAYFVSWALLIGLLGLTAGTAGDSDRDDRPHDNRDQRDQRDHDG